MNLVDGSDRDAGLGARVHGLAGTGKIHRSDSIGGRFIDAVGGYVDPTKFLEWSLFGGRPLPLCGRRCTGNRVVEIQPIEEWLLCLALASSPYGESCEGFRLIVRHRHCNSPPISAALCCNMPP